MRISGITLPDEKRIEIALMSIFGIGRSKSLNILRQAKVDPNKKAKDITEDQEVSIRRIVETLKIEGDLKREIAGNIKRLKDIQSYRGLRHSKRLPSRGQRTKTNARTLKGVKKTMGSGKKKTDKK